jgi:hypothetical protein
VKYVRQMYKNAPEGRREDIEGVNVEGYRWM